MSKIVVQVKWNKQLFEGIEIDLQQDILTFKSQIYALSNVPVDKQKIMAKGKILKDDTDWSSYPGIVDGAVLMLMGTAEGKELKAPEKEMVFVEDMTPEQKAKALQEKIGIIIPAGLENLGNTCYMNSVVQSLKRVNELKNYLENFELDNQSRGMSNDPNIQLTMAARNLMKDLDNKGESFAPMQFVQTMRRVFPMFDERDDHGHHKQQDADECFNLFVTAFQQAFKYRKVSDSDNNIEMIDDSVSNQDPITRLFGLEMQSTITNQEFQDEPQQIVNENILKLSCHIDNNNNPINSLQEGLNISLTGDVEKYSEFLGRNAVFKKVQKINKLPSYMCIQFVRFYWKKESNVGGTKAGKAKILRSVMYPKIFDCYNYCSDELKKSLDLGREFEQKLRAEEDRLNLEGKMKEKEESDKQLSGEAPKLTQEERDRKKLVGKAAKEEKKKEMEKEHDKILYRPHGQGLDTGNYELIAVVTHKGRSADGGHYMGWVHHQGDQWLCFDDDIVTSVTSEEILNLRGGGDWHTAYLCIYRKLEATK